jgi:hypothetical protein
VQASSQERSLYAVESPEVWFEDFGTGQLVNGQATVTIEPTFAQTVNLGEAYHVFVTPLSGEPVLLFVSEKTTTAFTVRGVTLEGQPAEVSFDYRIVAKRLGYEELRLEPVEMAYPDGGPGAEAVPAASDVGDEEPTFGESIIINVTESEE